MATNAAVGIGPPMGPDEEEAHSQRLREQYADEAERAVGLIEEKLAGMQQSLKAAKAQAKQLRAEAKEGVRG